MTNISPDQRRMYQDASSYFSDALNSVRDMGPSCADTISIALYEVACWVEFLCENGPPSEADAEIVADALRELSDRAAQVLLRPPLRRGRGYQ